MYKVRVLQVMKKLPLELILVALGKENCKKFFDAT